MLMRQYTVKTFAGMAPMWSRKVLVSTISISTIVVLLQLKIEMLAPAPSPPSSLLPSLPETTECPTFKPCYIKNAPECKDMVICLKPKEEDSYVSTFIRETGVWQGNTLDHLLSALHALPDAAFLDLGANIGDSVVPVAAMRPRRQVIAVDSMAINLAYIKRSLEKNLLWDTEIVRLVHSAVSDKRGILYPYTPDPSNPGDTRMLRKEEGEGEEGGEKNKEGVPAVLLQDILSSISSNTVILKLDVQGYECRTLQPSILLGHGGKFIPAIFIEWAMVARDTRVKKDCPDYENWKRNFFEGGYFPFEGAPDKEQEHWSRSTGADSRVTLKRIPDDGSLESVAMDVLWVHSSVDMRTAPCAPSSSEQCYLF